MGKKLFGIFLILIAAFILIDGSVKTGAIAESPGEITGFNGSKIKLYKDAATKSVWKRVPAKDFGSNYTIIGITGSRLAFQYDGREVWVKRKNVQTDAVASGLPPCPTLANVKNESTGNAVSRGSGDSCR